MKLVLVGYGRMGKLVEHLAPTYGFEVTGILNSRTGEGALSNFLPADVAVDFSTPAALAQRFPALAAAGLSVVIGTTGWQDREAELKDLAARSGIGVLASPNFSIGMAVFQGLVEDAARRFAARKDVGAWIHEAHHSAKKDAPSGTALMLRATMQALGYSRPIDVSSTRAGSIPGTHEVGFDSVAETVTLSHAVRDRSVFARGALEGAKWLRGRRGWFSMKDVIREVT